LIRVRSHQTTCHAARTTRSFFLTFTLVAIAAFLQTAIRGNAQVGGQALTEKGYDVNYSWGIQRHGQKMLQTVFPEMTRWLWRDHDVSTDVHDMVERSFNALEKKE
jgi:hypothetical protein